MLYTNHDVGAVSTDEGHESRADGPHNQSYIAEGVRHGQKPWPQATLDHVQERAQVPANTYYNNNYSVTHALIMDKNVNYTHVLFVCWAWDLDVHEPKQNATLRFSWPKKRDEC